MCGCAPDGQESKLLPNTLASHTTVSVSFLLHLCAHQSSTTAKGFPLHEESCQGWLVLQGGVGTSQLKILWVIAFLFQMPSYSTSVGITSFLVLLFGLWLVATQTATNANILIWGRQTHANIFIKWRQKRLLHSLINIKKKSFGYITRAPQHSPPDRYIYGLF